MAGADDVTGVRPDVEASAAAREARDGGLFVDPDAQRLRYGGEPPGQAGRVHERGVMGLVDAREVGRRGHLAHLVLVEEAAAG